MPSIPSTSISVAEIAMLGISASTGAGVKNIANVYHFKRASTVPVLVKANIEAAFQTAIGAKVLLALHSRYSQTFTTVRFPDDALDAPSSFVEAGVGAIAGDSNADYVTAVLQVHTDLRGKSYKGSKHYAPMSELDVDGDELTAAGLTLMGAIRTALLAGFTDSDGNVWTYQVLSAKLSQLALNPTTVVVNQVTRVVINKTTGTMKRRKTKTVT